MNTFMQRFAARISSVLSGFDRLRLRGSLRSLCFDRGMSGFLFAVGVRFKDFQPYVESTTAQVCEATKQLAQTQGRPLESLHSSGIDKEALAQQIMARDHITTGLIGIFGALESCYSYEIVPNRATRHLELRYRQRKCLHYYHYYLDPTFGFMHTRLQTWFPFSMQVCLNGREWLARQLDRESIAYQRDDNCFLDIANFARAQELLDQQLSTDWPATLDAIARRTNPAHAEIFARRPTSYYWSVDESEWATDILFHTSADRDRLYPHLVRHATECLSATDVLRFLGRQTPGTSEVHTSKKVRREGVRVKHRVAANNIKMYDKEPLRIETTINDVRGFLAYRPKEGDESGEKAWRPLRKGVADLHRRTEVSQAANDRYLEALATVAETTSLGELADRVCRPVRWHGRRVRALNPLAPDDTALLTAVNRGEFAINGFRNRDLRPLLFGDAPVSPSARRRQSAAVTRKLRLLRAHGLIRKVPKTHRYVLSAEGRTIINALLAARQADTAKLTQAA